MIIIIVNIKIYTKCCIPTDLFGIIFTPLITTNPFCKGLFYIFNKSTNMMDQMLIGFTMWFIPKITMFTIKNNYNVNNNNN